MEAIRHYYVYFDEANLKNYFVGKLNSVNELRESRHTNTVGFAASKNQCAPTVTTAICCSEKNGIRSRASDILL